MSRRSRWTCILLPRPGVAAAVVLLVSGAACTPAGSGGAEGEHEASAPTVTARVDSRRFTVIQRTPQLAMYPCVEQCHRDRAPNPVQRPLQEFHTLRQIQHGPGVHWCTTCHLSGDLDRLHLLDGEALSFDESYRLCGQCHGDKLRDWSNGIHGLQVGSWNGAAQRRVCAACHDPHVPGRMHVESLPAPRAAVRE